MAKKKGPSKGKNAARFVLTVGIMVMMMAATLAVLYYYMNYLIAKQYREGFEEDDVRSPVLEERPYQVETPPVLIGPGDANYSCHILWKHNGTSEHLSGYEGMGAVLNLSLWNDGRTDIYVEKAILSTGWGTNTEHPVGRYVDHDTTSYLRHLMIGIPLPSPVLSERSFRVSLDILVEGNTSWTRRGVDFESSPLIVLPLAVMSAPPEVEENYFGYFDKVNSLIEQDLDGVRSWLANTSLSNASYSVQTLVDAHQLVTGSIEYIGENKTESNEWLSPLECMARGGGDCEDFALLYGAVITVLGGSARVVITKDHAFNAIFLGEDGSILDALDGRYGADIPFFVMEDELGAWLIVEPQDSLVFGWPPMSVHPEEGNVQARYVHDYMGLTWNYDVGEEIYIVDIYIPD